MVNEREDTSDEDDPLYERLVEVVVTPALFKRGNTDGEQYDIETCIEPAKVRIVLLRKPTG